MSGTSSTQDFNHTTGQGLRSNKERQLAWKVGRLLLSPAPTPPPGLAPFPPSIKIFCESPPPPYTENSFVMPMSAPIYFKQPYERSFCHNLKFSNPYIFAT